MLTIAYLGFGNSVIRYHLPYLWNRPEYKVKSVYRRQVDRELPEEMERESLYPSIFFTSDINDVLSDPEINLVVINTPDSTHVEYTRMCISAGKNCLVEKPFAPSVKEAKELFDLAKKMNVVCYVNQNRRYDGDFLTLKKVYDSGVLGEIVEVESHYDYFRPNLLPEKENIGGLLFGLGVHNIDQVVSLFGIPEEVRYDVRGINSDLMEDFFDVEFYYEKMKVSIKSSFFVHLDFPRFIMHGKKGSFLKPAPEHLSSIKRSEPIKSDFLPESEERWGTLSYVNDGGKTVTNTIQTEVTDYGKVYDDLSNIINHGASYVVKEEEVLFVLKVLEEGRESMRRRVL